MEHIFNIIPGPQADSCCILLYGPIGGYEETNDVDIVTQLLEAERTYRKIDVRINSVGGDVFAGIAIFNALRQSKADITIYIDCIAASTASFIAGCGRRVKMSRYSKMMIHRPMSRCYGNSDELKTATAQLEQIERTLCQIYAERTGRTAEQVEAAYMDGADHWLTADEAVCLGFADEIYDDPRAADIPNSLSPQQRCEQYTARYVESVNVSLNTENQMFEKFKAQPAFTDCADEQAVMARISEIEAKARAHDDAITERDTYKAKVAEYEKKEREATEARYDAEVAAARSEERIGEDEVSHFQTLMRANSDSARALLAARKPKRRVMSVIGEPTADAGKNPWEERFDDIRNSLKQ